MSFIGKSPNVNRLRLNPRSSDPVSPTEGDLQYADGSVREEGLWVYKNGAWVRAGSSEDSGIKNYVSQTDSLFEGGIGGWTTFDDGTSYVDGTGGTATNLTISTTSVGAEVLEGSASFKISKAAADAQGEGTSVTLLTIDRADLGRTLYGSMEVDASAANYDSLGLKIFAYDITNAAILPVLTDNDGIPQGKGKVLFRILPSTNTAQIRLSLMVNTTNATAYEVIVDDVQVGPGAQIEAPIIADLGTEAWADSEANATTAVQLTRVGNRIVIDGRVSVTGAFSGSEFAITIPTPYTASSTYNLGATNNIVGFARIFDTGTGAFSASTLLTAANTLVIRVSNSSATYESNQALSATVPHTWANTDVITFEASYEVEGWTTGAVLSSTEAVNQTAKARASFAATSIPNQAVEGSETRIEFASATFDPQNLLTLTANSSFRVPKTGYIHVHGMLGEISAANASATIPKLFRNGTVLRNRLGRGENLPTSGTVPFTDVVFVNAGDLLDIRVFQNSGGARTFASGFVCFDEIADFTTFGVYGQREYYEVGASTAVAWPGAVNTAAQAAGAQLTLTPGEWELTAHAETFNNGALSGDMRIDLGIGTTAGSVAGLVRGKELNFQTIRSTNADFNDVDIPKLRVVISQTTTYFMNVGASGAAITNLQLAAWLFTARRMG